MHGLTLWPPRNTGQGPFLSLKPSKPHRFSTVNKYIFLLVFIFWVFQRVLWDYIPLLLAYEFIISSNFISCIQTKHLFPFSYFMDYSQIFFQLNRLPLQFLLLMTTRKIYEFRYISSPFSLKLIWKCYFTVKVLFMCYFIEYLLWICEVNVNTWLVYSFLSKLLIKFRLEHFVCPFSITSRLKTQKNSF